MRHGTKKVQDKPVVINKEKDVVIIKKLNPRQELFCRYYTQNNHLFGNATRAYAEAYGYKLDTLSKERPITKRNHAGEAVEWGTSEYDKACQSCAAQGERMLRNVEINSRANELMNDYLSEEVVDAQRARVIMQNENLNAKVAAIRSYDAVKGRITQKVDHNSKMVGVVKLFYEGVDRLEAENRAKRELLNTARTFSNSRP